MVDADGPETDDMVHGAVCPGVVRVSKSGVLPKERKYRYVCLVPLIIFSAEGLGRTKDPCTKLLEIVERRNKAAHELSEPTR